ncbi:hypothetical protein D3C85_1300840 [compost metagenome]
MSKPMGSRRQPPAFVYSPATSNKVSVYFESKGLLQSIGVYVLSIAQPSVTVWTADTTQTALRMLTWLTT